jgi:tetratricopeptide (TPR) repeat protein
MNIVALCNRYCVLWLSFYLLFLYCGIVGATTTAESTDGDVSSRSAAAAASDLLRQQADSLLKEGKMTQAIQMYGEAIEKATKEQNKNQNQYLNYYKRANAHLMQSNNVKALSDLNLVLQQKPNYLQVRD